MYSSNQYFYCIFQEIVLLVSWTRQARTLAYVQVFMYCRDSCMLPV